MSKQSFKPFFPKSFPTITKKLWLFIFLSLFLIISLHGINTSHAADSSRQIIRGNINPGGPEDWPTPEGLSTATVPAGQVPDTSYSTQLPAAPILDPAENQQAQHSQPENFPASLEATPPAQAQPALSPVSAGQNLPPQENVQPAPLEQHVPVGGRETIAPTSSGSIGLTKNEEAPAAPVERQVIYVDEEGNQVPKPPEPAKMLAEANTLMEERKYDEALALLKNIREIPGLSKEHLIQTLYAISDCVWNQYEDNPLAGYEPIISSANEAMNADLRNPRVPDALLRLGLANANVGNLDDASGYIVALQRRFPDYPGIAQGFTTLGQAQLKKNLNAEAERSFGIVLDKYPESSQLQTATVGLARTLINQGKDERANVILDFLGKRWPRYYISDPDFLLVQANNDEKMNRKSAAMDTRWLYVNLDPARSENAPLLLKMADEYMKDGQPQAANFIYSDIISNFPASPEAVTSNRRLAEHGIYDIPVSYENMEPVFTRDARQSLWKLYTDLAETSSTNPEGIMARLKQAMWLYWDKQYPEAMGKAGDFIDDYPEHPETPQAREILWRAFQKELANSLDEHNYGRILLLWNGFPYVREKYGPIDAPLRYALAEGWAERGDEQKSFELLSAFLKEPMDPKYGEAAFSKFFNHYLQQGAWNKILDLGNIVRNWRMKPELQNQLDYALALSAQNLNLTQPALNRWRNLANRTDIPLYQQAYATYFLARDAENRRDIRNAYENNRKVVQLFQKLADERSDKADPERIKEAILSLMDICEVGNRVPEALEWLQRYNAYVPEDSPDYPGLRFREARLYRKLGDNNRAHAILEHIVTKFPESPFAKASASELRTFDVSRDLERFLANTPKPNTDASTGSTSGNWSSTAPTATQ